MELLHSAPVDAENILPLLRTVSNLVEKRCHRFLSRQYGLTTPQYQLLLAVMYGDVTTLGNLADEINCSRGNLTGVADRLERDGWLVRERSAEDRRVINIRLTDKGTRVWEIRREMTKELTDIAKVWSRGERDILHNAMGRLYAELKSDKVPAAVPATA